MKFKCDHCQRPATIHLTEIVDSEKLEKHLCEDCASREGITIKANVPISQLLESFILQTGGEESAEEPDELRCDVCGLAYNEFRRQGLLGCPNDYDAFEPLLVTLLERAHEGGSDHLGKVPHSAPQTQKRHNAMLRLRSELKAAVAGEDYERAAVLRDQIKELDRT